MPYKNDPMEIIKECVLFKEAGVDILFMHQGIEGALKNSLKKDEDGISSSYLSDFYVLTGHYHTKHTVGDNITYLGATLSHTFAESNEDKYIYIFDSYTGLEELIPSCARKHLTIQFDNSMAYIPLIEYAPHDLIRIVVSGPKQWVDSISKEDLSEIYGVNISVQKSYTTDNKEFSILPNSDSLDSILIKYAQEQSLDDTLKTDIIAVIKETCNEV
jgi:DNA repair exonuclease SbcCD nuclease subunit